MPELPQSDSLSGLPTLSQVARILGIAPSTLSRRRDLVFERRGTRDYVFRRGEVLRLARIYRKRSIADVRHDLEALAEARRGVSPMQCSSCGESLIEPADHCGFCAEAPDA